jgi:hypothetical protein
MALHEKQITTNTKHIPTNQNPTKHTPKTQKIYFVKIKC